MQEAILAHRYAQANLLNSNYEDQYVIKNKILKFKCMAWRHLEWIRIYRLNWLNQNTTW